MDFCVVGASGLIENIIVCQSKQHAELFSALPGYEGAAIGTRYAPVATEESKSQRIAQSKSDLAAYLESHPLLWTDGEYYAITAEKQAQLTSKIMAATMARTLSTDYHLTWNSTGEVCKEWTLQDLSTLAFAIDARVTALVTYQQTQEVKMRNATTQEELDAIVVDYDTVGAAAQETSA